MFRFFCCCWVRSISFIYACCCCCSPIMPPSWNSQLKLGLNLQQQHTPAPRQHTTLQLRKAAYATRSQQHHRCNRHRVHDTRLQHTAGMQVQVLVFRQHHTVKTTSGRMGTAQRHVFGADSTAQRKQDSRATACWQVYAGSLAGQRDDSLLCVALHKLALLAHAAHVPKGVDQVPIWLLQLWWDLQRCPGNAARGPAAPSNIAMLLCINQSTMPERLVLPKSCELWASPHGRSPSAHVKPCAAVRSQQRPSSHYFAY
jgi:hypothetical protein